MAHGAWTNGPAKRFTPKIIKMGNAILSDAVWPVSQRVQVIPMVHWALNSSFSELYGSTPFEMFMDRQSATESYSAFSHDGDEEEMVNRHKPQPVQEMVMELARVRNELLNETPTKGESSRENRCNSQNNTSLWKYLSGNRRTIFLEDGLGIHSYA